MAQPSPVVSRARGKDGCSPLGRVTVTGSANSPVSKAVSADLVAAVAQAPVVQPRRSAVAGFSIRISFSPASMS
jgi:outer membrane receptor protein involved in Fe transport